MYDIETKIKEWAKRFASRTQMSEEEAEQQIRAVLLFHGGRRNGKTLLAEALMKANPVLIVKPIDVVKPKRKFNREWFGIIDEYHDWEGLKHG